MRGSDFLLHALDKEEKVILLSIKPEYSKLIFSGEKTIELRRAFPKLCSRYVLIYESCPTKKITGLLKIKKVHIKSIKKLLELSTKAKVTKTFINEYFKGKEIGAAVEIERVFELKEKIPLERLGFPPPQNFRYLRKEEIACLI